MPTVEKASSKIQNLLLAALPENVFDKLEPSLKLVDLKLDEVLWEMDEKRKHIYFPTTAMICLIYETDDGESIEVGMAGRQGMVGVVTFIGDARMAKRAVVMIPGQAYVMKAKDVEKYFEEIPDFQEICMLYTQTLLAQISQNVICNRLHSIEQQLCRLLLIINYNLQTTTIHLTHDRISNVLGVRRESVSAAAAKLQDLGLIEYARGKIKLLDRKGLLAAACECYEVVKDQYERILGKYISHHDS
ncbi:Transcriptional regulator, Crp/Fnr family [Nitrosomonas nitrosa]|uniref:Transcriptional regulator, Crp/Fnr family n=1 Tax=Nitrosomonas nitrosa TaxID=52442 RepID=A0A8H8Z0U0_9PROT|nr:Crp/Fnr family transcriptional regulator [Nitrosomonas nitrosa]CAE6505931.1 Transcriptional regulator, Crp/Fnr family [Nitrosomonas nitrosa]